VVQIYQRSTSQIARIGKFCVLNESYVIFTGEEEVASYYCELINLLSTPALIRKDLVKEFALSITKFDFSNLDKLPPNKTLIIPSLQMGFYGIRQDEGNIQQLLQNQGEVWISTPYLNFTRRMKRLLASRREAVNVMTASPPANGFYNSKGLCIYCA
jgi:hypothetical protein